MKAKPRPCPRCGGMPNYYIEWWTAHSIDFTADVDGYPGPDGNLRDGVPRSVDAVCGCGHRWTLRGVRQITDLERTEEKSDG